MKTRELKLSLTVMAVAALALTGCNSVKQQMGFSRQSPDEFLVVKRAPLTLPPNYALRAPAGPDEIRPATQASQEAEAVISGKTSSAPSAKKDASKQDAAFLDKLGTANADPSVRTHLDEDNGYVALQNRSVADKLIFWQEYDPSIEDAQTPVVDAKKEAERLKQNKQEGKPLNTGDVPVIEKKSGTIDKIF